LVKSAKEMGKKDETIGKSDEREIICENQGREY
jgi:hypothetical protein